MRRVVQAEPVVGGVPVDGILDAAVDSLVALAALRAVVLQLGVGVADAVLEPVREALLEDDLERRCTGSGPAGDRATRCSGTGDTSAAPAPRSR